MTNNQYDPNLMQKLFEMYKNGQIPNMPPNPGQMPPNPGQMPAGNPGQMPFTNTGQMPFTNQGQMSFPNQGQMPFPNQGQMPFPNQVQMPFPNQGQMPFPNQGQMPFPNQTNQMFTGGGYPYPFTNVNPYGQQGANPNAANWNLIFERKSDGQRINIQIANDKTLEEACNNYRIKSNEFNAVKFSSNGKPLNTSLILNASGLDNNSVILVEPADSKPSQTNNFANFYPQGDKINLIFELKGGGQTMTIQVSPDKLVSEAINSYKNKIQIPGDMKFIVNGLNLDPNLTIKAAGLRNGAKILVITTKDIEGA